MENQDVMYDVNDVKKFFGSILNLIDLADSKLNNMRPSQWVEENIVFDSEMSDVRGPFRYHNSPLSREIIDQLDRTSPVKEIVCMKGAQSGLTDGAVLPGLAWMIKNDPSNAMLMVGHESLLETTVSSLDSTIDSAKIRSLIQSNSKRSRNTKSGDTDSKKEYAGGYLLIRKLHPDSLRQVSIRVMVVDDYDAIKSDSKKDGDIATLIDKRTNTYKNSKKIFKISTPTIKGSSNIERAYNRGDKRKYHIPCPCCNEFIILEWETQSLKDPKKMAGITWELNEQGKLISDTVGYVCQKCDGWFDDSNKMSWLNAGKWVATQEADIPGVVSYHMSGLYSSYFMDGWLEFVYQWLEAQTESSKAKKETLLQAFTNLVLGQTYEKNKVTVSSNKLQENIRKYERCSIPEKISIADGNGKIVLITCGMDLNGKEDDARIDYEIKAYSAGGQSYSIDHGSFGTFIPKDKHPEKRAKMTYRHGASNSVWKEVEKLIAKKFENDNNGKEMRIFYTTIDTGYMTEYAYTFIDSHKNVAGVKGRDDEDTTIRIGADMRTFKKAQSRKDLYLVEVNYTKDIIASHMGLLWTMDVNESQPFGFMNFPIPSNGKYLHTNFFKHYESEEKRIDNGKYRWVRRQGFQNHLWDCCIYAEVAKDIFVYNLLAQFKVRNGTWNDYVQLISDARNK